MGVAGSGGESGEDGEPPSADECQTVRCTPGHPWWVEGRQRWVLAGDLRVGDQLRLDDGRLGFVLAVESRREVARTFNFEVEGLHAYFVAPKATSVGVLVHNMSRAGVRRVAAGIGSVLGRAQGFSASQFKKFSRAARRLVREADLPVKGDLVVQGSRARGTARLVGAVSDIDIALRVSKEDFVQLAETALARAHPGSNLRETMLARIRRGQLSSFDLGTEFTGLRRRILDSTSKLRVQFSVILEGSEFDTAPFLSLGRP